MADMKNMEVSIDGNKMTIVVDLSQTVDVTAKGAPVIGKTQGFATLTDHNGDDFWMTAMIGRKRSKSR